MVLQGKILSIYILISISYIYASTTECKLFGNEIK